MTYEEMIKKHSKEVEKFPIIWAFGKDQLENGLREWGLTTKNSDLQKIVSIGCGGYMRKTDIAEWHNLLKKQDKELRELMKDFDWLVDAFEYEMWNHEYDINMDADYDVLSCFYNVDKLMNESGTGRRWMEDVLSNSIDKSAYERARSN